MRMISSSKEGKSLHGAKGSLIIMRAFYNPCTQYNGFE